MADKKSYMLTWPIKKTPVDMANKRKPPVDMADKKIYMLTWPIKKPPVDMANKKNHLFPWPIKKTTF